MDAPNTGSSAEPVEFFTRKTIEFVADRTVAYVDELRDFASALGCVEPGLAARLDAVATDVSGLTVEHICTWIDAAEK